MRGAGPSDGLIPKRVQAETEGSGWWRVDVPRVLPASRPESLTLSRPERGICFPAIVCALHPPTTLWTPTGVLTTEPDFCVPFPSSQKHAHQERSSLSAGHVLFSPRASGISVHADLRLRVLLRPTECPFSSRPTEGERTERLIKAKLRSIMMSQDLENVTSKEVRELLPLQARGHRCSCVLLLKAQRGQVCHLASLIGQLPDSRRPFSLQGLAERAPALESHSSSEPAMLHTSRGALSTFPDLSEPVRPLVVIPRDPRIAPRHICLLAPTPLPCVLLRSSKLLFLISGLSLTSKLVTLDCLLRAFKFFSGSLFSCFRCFLFKECNEL